MIQRIQSLFLLLVTLLSALALFGGWPFYSASGAKAATLTFTSSTINDVKVTEVFSMLLMAAILGLSVYIIFLFKNRKLQLLYCWILIAMVVLSAILAYLRYRNMSAQLMEQTGVEGRIGIMFLFPLLMLLSVSLAMRGIWKDELLVRNMDRLR
jgi:hypothetical protein